MDDSQRRVDVKNGLFVLEQYKLRKKLGLLKNKQEKIELICSKYQDLDCDTGEDFNSDLETKSSDSKIKEFERVLQELQRRENLIRELLVKLEHYESTSKQVKLDEIEHLSNYEEFSKDDSYIIDTKETNLSKPIEKNIYLWKCLLNTAFNVNSITENKCEEEGNGIKKKCIHKLLLDIYKKEILFLIDENDKLKSLLLNK